MARPTKEEAQGWRNLFRRCWEAHESLERDEYDALVRWLNRLVAVLPSAAAVQRARRSRSRPKLVKAGENDEGPIDPRHLPSQEE